METHPFLCVDVIVTPLWPDDQSVSLVTVLGPTHTRSNTGSPENDKTKQRYSYRINISNVAIPNTGSITSNPEK